MISIIICCRTQTISKDLSENIKKTVGCDYELIIIDNSDNRFSIFEAYNKGIYQSTSPYLCFLHDDIKIYSVGWGNTIIRLFNENQKIGLIGVAGSKIKTKMPSAWWDCPEDQKVINIIQHFPNKQKEKWKFGFENSQNIEVVTIDGVFMALRKDQRICFNTKISGFHNYDLNISLEYKRYGYQIMVTNEILLEHFSIGTLNEAWVDSNFQLHSFYKNILPLSILKSKINKEIEITNAIRFINQSLKFKKNKLAYSTWRKLFLLNPGSKYHIQFWKTMLKNRIC
jgi:hypothetical protein